jgi:molybdate transport system regulatory protein
MSTPRLTTAAAKRRPIASEGPFARAAAKLRIAFDDGRQLGPGKIDLVEAIAHTGSIAAAAREMGMSERRALLLVDAVNRFFRRPVVVGRAPGDEGGGEAAELTPFGRELVAAYRRVEDRTRAAIREELAPFEAELAADDGALD